jgi:Pyruvate/2-oxoacid:ferredoxin oxidoreductase gamma subunit
VHRFYLKPQAAVFVNSAASGDYFQVDARTLAQELGAPVTANLILLGFAAARGGLFCAPDLLERVIREKTPPRFLELNLKALRLGAATAG